MIPKKFCHLFQFGSDWMLLAFFGLLSTFCVPKSTPASRPPNLVVIYTDDQRIDALGAWNNRVIKTPNLDRMAAQAVRFTESHVVFSLCSPSRAAMLTGRYGSANGVLHLGSGLNSGEKTIAQYLKNAGYRTAMMGKWHLKQSPQELGFEEATYFLSNGRYYGRKIFERDSVFKPDGHCDEYCVGRSMEYLERVANQNEPFFLLHCTQLPHMNGKLIWDAKEETKALYDPSTMPVASSRLDDNKPAYLRQVRNRIKSADYGYPDSSAIQQHTLEYIFPIELRSIGTCQFFDFCSAACIPFLPKIYS